MAATDFSWIYLIIFMAIPLARIIPRLLARRRKENNPFQTLEEKQSNPFQKIKESNPFQTTQEKQIQPSFDEFPNKPQREISEPKTNKMRVLGEINKRSMTFENIQRNTKLDNKQHRQKVLQLQTLPKPKERLKQLRSSMKHLHQIQTIWDG